MSKTYSVKPIFEENLYDEVTQKALNAGLTDRKCAVDGDIIAVTTSLRMSFDNNYPVPVGQHGFIVQKDGATTYVDFRNYIKAYPQNTVRAALLVSQISDDSHIRTTTEDASKKLFSDDENTYFLSATMTNSAMMITHDDTEAAIDMMSEDGVFAAEDIPKYFQIVLKKHASSHELVAVSEQVSNALEIMSDFMQLREEDDDGRILLTAGYDT